MATPSCSTTRTSWPGRRTTNHCASEVIPYSSSDRRRRRRGPSGDLAEVFHLRECAQLPQGVLLDLPDALPRHAEDSADLLQGCRRLSVASVPAPQQESLA